MKSRQFGCFPPLAAGWNQGPREYQEDYFGVASENGRTLMVVADGMGGHSSGDLASRWTVEALMKRFRENQEPLQLFPMGIAEVVQKMQLSGKDMGCTMVAALISPTDTGYRVTYTWVGDSRLYVIGRGNAPSDNAKKIAQSEGRTLWLLSDDDSFVWGFFLNGELSIDQLTRHPNKNQLEFSVHPSQDAIHQVVEKRVRSFQADREDMLFLCTDGVWESFAAQSALLKLLQETDPGKSLQSHLKQALRTDQFNDNGTYLVARLNDSLREQNCFPENSGRRFVGPVIAGFLALILFILIFLLLIRCTGDLESRPLESTLIGENSRGSIADAITPEVYDSKHRRPGVSSGGQG